MVSKNIACLSVFLELCLMSVEMLTSLSSAAPIEWYKNSLISSSSIIHGIFATRRQEGKDHHQQLVAGQFSTSTLVLTTLSTYEYHICRRSVVTHFN